MSYKNKILTLALIMFCLILTVVQGQTGLYMRTQLFGSQLDVSWLFFTNDNKVVRNPKFGVNPIQIQKEIAENKNNVASFTLSENKMNLKWNDGKTQTINVEFKNGVLVGLDGGICSRASAFKNKYFDNKTYSGLANFGSISRSVTIFLGKDGRFKTEKIGAVSGSGNISGAAASKSNDAGTYIINGNTITFKYDNGTQWIVVAQPYDLGKEEVIINDQLFKIKQL